MMIAKRIYAALQDELPNMSDVAIGNHIGAGHSGISKLSNGKGIGLSAAKWLAEHNSKYADIYKEAKRQDKISRAKAEKKRKATRERNDRKGRLVNPARLSPYAQSMCGYVGGK